MTSKCHWCGKPYTKKHNRQTYCTDKCRKEAKKEQNRNNFHRWYHKNKHKPGISQKNQLGTRPIGSHKNKNPKKEYEIIQKELHRIGLRNNTH